jgi:hypothetical protein
MFRRFRRAVLVLSVAGVLAGAVAATSAAPAMAYGKANWQVTFAGTGIIPSTGLGFGFWGWCDFAGGVTSGTSGDCQYSQYFHAHAGGGFTCQESVDFTTWDGSGGTFVGSGTVTVHPAGVTTPCLAFFPGTTTTSFTNVDFGIPSAAGHYNFGPLGVVGEFQMQVTQVS